MKTHLGSAAVKRFWDDGQPEQDLPFLRWSCEHALQRVQESLLGVLDNFPSRATAVALRSLAFPLGARYRPPDDSLVAEVARALGEDGEARWRLTADIHVPGPQEPGLGTLEAAFRKLSLAERAFAAGVIDPGEARTIREAELARARAIAVDAFSPEEYASHRRAPAA